MSRDPFNPKGDVRGNHGDQSLDSKNEGNGKSGAVTSLKDSFDVLTIRKDGEVGVGSGAYYLQYYI